MKPYSIAFVSLIPLAMWGCGQPAEAGNDAIPTTELVLKSAHMENEHEVDAPGLMRVRISRGADNLVGEISSQLNSKDEAVRTVATQYLGDTCLTKATPDLVKMLGDSSLTVQHAALVALGQVQDPKSLPDLIKYSQQSRANKDSFVVPAPPAQGQGRRRQAAPAKPTARDNNIEVIRTLSCFKDPSAKQEVIQHLQDSDGKAKMTALQGLADMGATDQVPAITKLYNSTQDVNAKLGAAAALLTLAPQSSNKDQIHAFVEPLLGEGGAGLDRDERGTVIEVVGLIGDKKDLDAVIRGGRRAQMDRLFPALARIGGPGAIRALQTREENNPGEVAWYIGMEGKDKVKLNDFVVSAKGPLEGEADSCVVGAILRMSQDKADRAIAYQAADKLLSDPSWKTRYVLALAMEKVSNDPQAQQELEKLKKDPYEYVRRAASGEIVDTLFR